MTSSACRRKPEGTQSMEIKTDIEIAQACEKKKITEIAKTAGVDEKSLPST